MNFLYLDSEHNKASSVDSSNALESMGLAILKRT